MDKENYIIWSNDPGEREDLESYKSRLIEEGQNLFDVSDNELLQRQAEENSIWLDDERQNLDLDLGRPIIAIASIGRWNGRVDGYRMIESGNIKDCLRGYVNGYSYNTMYVTKDGEFRQNEYHHDGVNYITYRLLRKGISENQLENLQNSIYNGNFSQRQVERYTQKIGPFIAKVYGWKLQRGKVKMSHIEER